MCHPIASRLQRLITCLSISLLGASCTGGDFAESSNASSSHRNNRPPVITSAKILSDPILLTIPVAVQINAEDPEREPIAFRYQWYVDHVALVGQTKPTLPAEQLKRGQAVSVEVIPSDGSQEGKAYRTAAMVVGNAPPRISVVTLSPQTIEVGGKLEAQVEASDPDHDRVDLTYKWLRNDAPIKEGDESFLDTTGFSTHDKIMVEVTAKDPSLSGNSLKSEPLVLGNSAPKIVSEPPTTASEDHFDYQVKAIDPDGDQLTYHLETAQPGMTISAESGHIAWRFPSDQQGTFRVKLVAKDSQGGMAFQEFDLTLTAAGPPKSSGA